MLDADELAEIRALHARAYGRDAELTDADAARLRELEGQRVAGAAATNETRVAEPRETWVAEPDAASGPEPSTRPEPEDGTGAKAQEETGSAPWGGASVVAVVRAFWRPLAIAAAAALIVGVGLGWFLFGRPVASSVALTPVQQEWQNAVLAEGIYDTGSVRAVAVEEGFVVWTATKDERKNTCLILSNGDATQPSCRPADSVDEEGLWGSLVVEIGDKVRREVMAWVLFTPSGDAAVQVQVTEHTPGSSSITYATDEETVIAERLAEDGYDPYSIWVAGYDGDVPIWTATERESQAQCLIFDGSSPTSPRVCADPQTMTEQESELVLNVVDTESGRTTTFEMSSNYGPSYLVITRERGELGVGGD